MMTTRKRLRDEQEVLPSWRKSARLTNGLKQDNGETASAKSAPKDTKIADRLHSLAPLYSTSVQAKLWAIAQKGLGKPSPPTLFPEYTNPAGTEYIYRELDFWTSGFFPGTLYALLERQRKYSHFLPGNVQRDGHRVETIPHDLQLDFACKWWTENLHQNASLTGTHDIGFMIAPWARRAWELNHDERARHTLCTAARTLASRYSSTVGCLRSWDVCVTKKYKFHDPNAEFLVIIDNMMNLDLLFTAASYTNSPEMRDMAVAHARKTQQAHVRSDFSTTHLVVFDPATGELRSRLTNQGFSHTSCWTRGQAWAIAGFAETYRWTLDPSFLATARGCADYFLRRLSASASDVPPWDFDSPNDTAQPRDTSAALIAAYGLLLLEEALRALGEPSAYLDAALRLIAGVTRHHLHVPAVFQVREHSVETVEHGLTADTCSVEVVQPDEPDGKNGNGASSQRHGETIVGGATINNYEFAPRRWADHGLVYADYYFVVVGNKLLEMGIGGHAATQIH